VNTVTEKDCADIVFQMELMNPDQDVRGEVRISAVKYPPSIWMRIRKREPVEVVSSAA